MWRAGSWARPLGQRAEWKLWDIPARLWSSFGPCFSSFAITFLDVPSASNPIMTSRVLAVLLRQSLMEAKFGFQWGHDFSVMEGMCIGRRPATSQQFIRAGFTRSSGRSGGVIQTIKNIYSDTNSPKPKCAFRPRVTGPITGSWKVSSKP